LPDERHGGGLLLDEPGEDVQHGGRFSSAVHFKAALQERQDNLHYTLLTNERESFFSL